MARFDEGVLTMTGSWLCRIGLHRYVDFPDPNPEAGGLESMDYQACTRCPKERDTKVYHLRGYTRNYPPRRKRRLR
jgi:hypothetical protein